MQSSKYSLHLTICIPGEERRMALRCVRYPICQSCNECMRIIRRGSHVDERGYFERQEFACAKCDFRVERKVMTDGTVQPAV